MSLPTNSTTSWMNGTAKTKRISVSFRTKCPLLWTTISSCLQSKVDTSDKFLKASWQLPIISWTKKNSGLALVFRKIKTLLKKKSMIIQMMNWKLRRWACSLKFRKNTNKGNASLKTLIKTSKPWEQCSTQRVTTMTTTIVKVITSTLLHHR